MAKLLPISVDFVLLRGIRVAVTNRAWIPRNAAEALYQLQPKPIAGPYILNILSQSSQNRPPNPSTAVHSRVFQRLSPIMQI
jgi:hypothetical protein